MKEGADARSVTDHSPLSDGTLEMEDGSRRRKSVRLVQRLKGFVRLVYLICELSFYFVSLFSSVQFELGNGADE